MKHLELIFLFAACSVTNIYAENIALIFRSQKQGLDVDGRPGWLVVEEQKTIKAEQTILIVTDIWEEKGCRAHVERIKEMVPVINQLVATARSKGVYIIWSPSGVTDYYNNDPARKRMIDTPFSLFPTEISVATPPLPVGDQTVSCDSEGEFGRVERQHPGLIVDQAKDGISSDGQEIWNFIKNKEIKLVLICGVHTDACILNRPFAIKQMIKWQMPITLIRDLTDASYNPYTPPYVSHEEGTSLVVEYIEKFWCPTVSIKDVAGLEPVSFAPWKNTVAKSMELPISKSRGPLYQPPQPKYHILLRAQYKALDAKKLNIWRTQEMSENIMANQSAILIIGINRRRSDFGSKNDSLVSRINSFASAARRCGYSIIHAPAGSLVRYQDAAARIRIKASSTPDRRPENTFYFAYLNHWQPAAYFCKPTDALYESPLPVLSGAKIKVDSMFYDQTIPIDQQQDCISNSAAEIWHFMQEKKIKNIFVLGRYANDDFFSAPYGVKQMAETGVNIAVIRDMIDIISDPFDPPYVSHNRALTYMIGYFEKFWCPTVYSEDLLSTE